MEALNRVLSPITAKPFRTRDVEAHDASEVYVNDKGLIDFAPNDPENPKNWSKARRWYITVVCNLIVVNATFASSSPSGAANSIAETFHVSMEVVQLVTSLFLCGYCFGPLLWAPLSEFFGRRYVFYGTFICYFAFNFLCAFAPNIGSLLAGRFLSGTFASAALSNSPGVLADLWGPLERGNAMALFTTMTFAGPALGPVISGFLELKKDWRWSFYVLLWMGGATIALMFTIPETTGPQILNQRAKRIRAKKIPGFENVKSPLEAQNRSLKEIFKVALTRPWLIFFDPISFLCAVYMSVVYMLLYMLFTIYPIVFQEKRGWNSGVGELPLLGTMIGAALGGIVVWLVSKRDAKRDAAGIPRKPEDRLPVAMAGSILFPICMFWFAWTAQYNSIHWIVPTIAGTFLAASILLIFVAYMNYLTDTYLMFAASALAANTVMRSAAGAAAPLFTSQMFDALGVGGGGSLIGGVACLMLPIPFIFYKYGEKIRQRSKFAPTMEGNGPKMPPGGMPGMPGPQGPPPAGAQRDMQEQKPVEKHDDSDSEDDLEDEEEEHNTPQDDKKEDHKERAPSATDVALHRLSQRMSSYRATSGEIPVDWEGRQRQSMHSRQASYQNNRFSGINQIRHDQL